MNNTIPKLKLCLQLSPILSFHQFSTSIVLTDTDKSRAYLEEITPTTPNFTLVPYEYDSSISIASLQTMEDDEDIPTLDLLLSFSAIDEDTIFQDNGYQKIEKICDTLQGELFKAIKINSQSTPNPHYVAIKKTDKGLLKQRIAIQDDINFCVSENIIKESLILKYLTVDNQPIGDYIVKYIDLFQSDTDYYLVMEYIDSQMNLREFVTASHQHIQNNKLSMKEYNKMIKYILWQLFVTIQWLHISMHCCHLDVCMENIMLINSDFIKTKHGVSINPQIAIKLVDFGVAEIFQFEEEHCINSGNINCFLCEKQGLSLENEKNFAPKVFNGDIFDARCADNWLLGIILFECITNKQLYGAMDIYTNSIKSGYWSLYHDKLKKYLAINNLLKYFSVNSFDLLNRLLNINQYQRLKGIHILKHKWFKIYYKRYQHQILKKFKPSNLIQISQYDHFPFYR